MTIDIGWAIIIRFHSRKLVVDILFALCGIFTIKHIYVLLATGEALWQTYILWIIFVLFGKEKWPKTLKPQNPKTPKPQNPKTPKPQNPKTPKPQNPKTPKPQNPKTSKPQNSKTTKSQNPKPIFDSIASVFISNIVSALQIPARSSSTVLVVFPVALLNSNSASSTPNVNSFLYLAAIEAIANMQYLIR